MSTDQPALVSVIIPFFNEETIIENAIKSIINQSYSRIELLLINDQSTDGSNAICHQYTALHDNIFLHQNKHKGIGAARNLGLEKANGIYISFLDADDIYQKNAIEQMVNQFVSCPHTGLVVGKFDSLLNNQKIGSNLGWKHAKNIHTGLQAAELIYSGGIVYTVWAKLFRKSVLEGIKFPSNLWFEDRPFMLSACLNCSDIAFLDSVVLINTVRSNSVTRSVVSEKRLQDLTLIFEMELTIIDRYTSAVKLQKPIISHHLNSLLESVCLIKIDFRKLTNKNLITACFKTEIQQFDKIIYERGLALTTKQKVFLQLLKTYHALPWTIYTNLLCNIIFRKRFMRVQELKGLQTP